MIGLLALRRTARWLAVRVLEILPDRQLLALLADSAIRRARSVPPADGLRFLFGLEAALYPAQGQLAVAYGGGVHTKHRHMCYHDFFVARIRPDDRVLDVGCGIGALAYDVAERAGAETVGIDVDESSIGFARRFHAHLRVRYVVGDALLTLPGEPFDVVILSNVLEHLPDRTAFVKRVMAAVAPSLFLIRVPLLERDWRVPLKRELGVEWRLDATHYVEYTPQSFAEEMAAAGLGIVHQEVRWGEIWAEAHPLATSVAHRSGGLGSPE